ncbi:lecithin retinol acyltransferase family protein [uncultured Megasphaera sp.]|uniref:lecithin retinol acyltransferase family protein n=1 Tax=uncultured Megasphaera sp. TaxID=165188 RepID=UPI0025DE89BD|nr:lecithin retinol acyltransferase family protein [uncultured Megasphaera sp.]
MVRRFIRNDGVFPIFVLGTFISCESEKWECRRPVKGDHIRVKRYDGLYAHHGIYVSDEEVIHFTGTGDDSVLDWSQCRVIKTSLARFLAGGTLEVKDYTDDEFSDLYAVEQIVQYARFCLGDSGYHLIFNNCEHFANACTLGAYRSHQVERFFSGRMPNEEEESMGFFSSVGNFFKGLFGGSSERTTHSYNYEPDKVKIAEIENRTRVKLAQLKNERVDLSKQIESSTKVKLAHLENERVDRIKQARIEILQYETQSQLALKEAQVRGFQRVAETITEMQKQLNDIAQKRLLILEKGSLSVIHDVEVMYDQLNEKINRDNDIYNTEKLPKLLDILAKYEKDSPAYALYQKRIDDDTVLHMEHISLQFKTIQERQNRIVDSILADKNKLIDQANSITLEMLTHLNQQIINLEEKNIPNLTGGQDNLLSHKDPLALSEKKEPVDSKDIEAIDGDSV